MAKSTDLRVVGAALYFAPITTRVPLKFGTETVTSVTVARASVTVTGADGRRAVGWGETPLSVQWVWPSALPYETRHRAMQAFCARLAAAWAGFSGSGHAMEVGFDFQTQELPRQLASFNAGQPEGVEPMPWLAALVCCSLFDLALHDAYGRRLQLPVYETYHSAYLGRDLSEFLEPASGTDISFRGAFPRDYLVASPSRRVRAWHLVGGLDLLEAHELTGKEPNDGYPVTLREWIRRDGLTCLKIKLRGQDAGWDYERLTLIGAMAQAEGVEWLTADFNCTVTAAAYVNDLLDRLRDEHPRIYGMILYVEQPFPYDLEHYRIDAHSVAARKPLFLDESAHDWKMVRLGRALGWTGVALKTCKTQTGALLSACWARAHGMALMVQDLTNPMLAQIPHVLLAAHAGTIMGVETNAMQFYPEASAPEATVHTGLYTRRHGCVDWSTVTGPGFGMRVDEIPRRLPPPVVQCGA
jgi:L-alanine-DL-glutamate epimerase-like enolase superfamily enzyme